MTVQLVVSLPFESMTTHPAGVATHRRRWRSIVLAFVLVLAIFNVVRSALVPGGFHFPLNVSIGVLAVVVGWSAGLSREDLGLGSEHRRAGVRDGLAATGVVAAATAIGALASLWVPAVGDAVTDAAADVSLAQLLLRVLFVIPLGTVLMEELVFRGVVLGALLRATSVVPAVVMSSLFFGLWHIAPAFRGLDDPSAVEFGVTVTTTLLATTFAGVVFAWLRVRSQSLVAPVLAHLATNTVPLTMVWLLN